MSGKKVKQGISDQKNIYQAIILPVFFSILSSLAPELSLPLMIITGGYCLLLIIVIYISKFKEWYRHSKFRFIFSFSLIDTSTVMAAVFVTRMLDGGIYLFLILVCLLLLTMVVGHRYRRRIGEELTEPKTVIGKLLISFGSLGGGLAALLAYWSTQFVPGVFIGAFIYGGMLLVVLIFHAHWPLDD